MPSYSGKKVGVRQKYPLTSLAMKTIDLVRLFTLAAIWGGSFIFLRILSPVLGPILTTNLRLFIGGLVLCLYFAATGFDLEWKKNWKHYLIIGVINSAIPFSLFAYGALYLPASYEVILNSTSPMFGAVFSWLWLSDKMTLPKIGGLVLASAGVGMVVDLGSTHMNQNVLSAMIACLVAASCYALAGVYIKKFASHIKPLSFAGGCQLVAGLILIPLSLANPMPESVSLFIVLNVLGIALLCSAIAYLLYYQLIADVGPTKALTVTFLMPVFGMIWGALFLRETITVHMIVGTVLILAGTWFVVKKVKS